MTTAAWLLLPAVLLPVSALRPTQDVDPAMVLAKWRTPLASWCGDELPHVVEWDGRWWIEDGHHRVAYAIRRAEHHLWCRLLDIRYRG